MVASPETLGCCEHRRAKGRQAIDVTWDAHDSQVHEPAHLKYDEATTLTKPLPAASLGLPGHEVAPRKREAGFSLVSFGEVLCKRLKPAHDAVLAHVEARASSSGRSSLGRSQLGRTAPVFAPTAWRGSVVMDGLPSPAAVRPSYSVDLRRKELEFALPSFSGRSAQPMTSVSRAGSAATPLTYGEYLSWLQRALPESMRPVGPELDGPLADAECVQESSLPPSGVSALELLRRISVGNKEPEPDFGERISELEEQLEERDQLIKQLQIKIKKSVAKPTVPPLTDEECVTADTSLESGDSLEVLCSRFNVDLTRGQLACLRPCTWLNDEVINFYFKLLEERSRVGKAPTKCWFPNSFFWSTLSGSDGKTYNYKGVRRWTIKAKVDIFAMDHVIFPMNIGHGTHWTLGIIDIKGCGFRYLDSMSKSLTPMANFIPFLRRYVDDEHKAKKNGVALDDPDSWQLLQAKSAVPQQRNGYDCGVFTCFFADYFSAGKDLTFSQDDMPTLRLRLAARVVKADEDFDEMEL